MTSSQHGLYILGYTHATMAGTMGSEGAIRSESSKTGPSSDCRLQLACMKMELLVNAGQRYCVEYVPGLELLVNAGQRYCVEYVPGPCTHRPSRHGSWQHLKPVS